MRIKLLPMLMALPVLMLSCVSNKKYKSLNAQFGSANQKIASLEGSLSKCNSDLSASSSENAALNKRITDFETQVKYLKENNTQALAQLENLSVISKQQADNIKKSMENIGAKDVYIQTLQQQMAYKDSLNMALVMNLKGAIGDIEDEDINIKVDKGVVYIDISDKLLFKSGSYIITDKAKTVLGKVATVLKNQPDLEFMVEGHTDNVPYRRNAYLLDNWDLSVKRATSVVRVLQTQYGIDPAKISAAGRSEYVPIDSNDSNEGKARNRRTRIVILPELDQFFKLLEPKQN